jgi:hypothetical protein
MSATPNQISQIIKHKPKGKAPGHDNIRNIDFRNLHINAIRHPMKTINAAIQFQHFPKTWNKATIVSV